MPDEKETPDTATIWARVQELMSRRPAAAEPDPERSVPYARFSEVNAENKVLREAAAAWEGAKKAEIARVVAELQAVHTKEREATTASHAEDLTFARRGVDDLGRTVIRTGWEATPADKRGTAKTASEWWEAQVSAWEAHTKDPDKAPAPELHPTLLALLPAKPAADPARGRRPQVGTPAPGAKREAEVSMESVRGKGRLAVLEAIGRAPPKE